MLKKCSLILLVLLAVLTGCGDNQSTVGDKPPVQLPKVPPSEYQKTPFTETDAQALGVMIDQSFKEVTKVLKDPLKIRKEESEAVGFQLIAKYKFGELTFDALDDIEGNSTLSVIIINQPKVKGPRDIQVGDPVEEVLAKFPQKENPVAAGVRTLYNLQDDELTGQITYDKKKQITSVGYAKGFGGFGTYSLEFAIENGLVTEIRISVINV